VATCTLEILEAAPDTEVIGVQSEAAWPA